MNTPIDKTKRDKMLILGYEYPGIKCKTWKELEMAEINEINEITDYQILLIDLEHCDLRNFKSWAEIRNNIIALIENLHIVIIFLPRNNEINNYINLLPGQFILVKNHGVSIEYTKVNDPIIDIFQDYIKTHDVVIADAMIGNDMSRKYFPFLHNNIKGLCGLKFKRAYIINAPEKHYHAKAIASIINHLNPEPFEEEYVRPTWVDDIESKYFDLDEINNKITKKVETINKIKEEILEIEKEKDDITKWSDLLYTQGNTLELRLVEAFKFLGAKSVEHEPKGSHGPDLTIEHNELGFTIEVQGSNGNINIYVIFSDCNTMIKSTRVK